MRLWPPCAGCLGSPVYTYRHLARRGTPGRVAGWLLVATGIVSFATLALLAVVGVQLRGLLSGCAANDALELVALTSTVAVGIALLARVSMRPPGFGRLGRYLQRVVATMQRLARCSVTPENGDPSNIPAVALRGRDWAVAIPG
jgi:hypothetical protein